jgi:hypothetical protein
VTILKKLALQSLIYSVEICTRNLPARQFALDQVEMRPRCGPLLLVGGARLRCDFISLELGDALECLLEVHVGNS